MNLVVRPAKIGLGAFAIVPFRLGDLIWDWSNHPLFEKPPRILPEYRFQEISPGILTGPLGPDKYPDAYLNHSCEPNAEILFKRPTIHLVARRAIFEGEEVTFDYATLYERSWSMRCSCGTQSCRRIIRGSI